METGTENFVAAEPEGPSGSAAPAAALEAIARRAKTQSMSGFVTARIVRKQNWAPGLATLTLDFVPETFEAGQFFQLGLELEGRLVTRSYSAASAPGAPLEVFLSKVEGGQLTPRLFDLAEGEALQLSPKGLGFFVLSEVPPARVLWLVSTGTGLGPFIAMLRQGPVFERFELICVVQGVRHTDRLAYQDELEGYAASQKVRYVPIVSGEAPPPGGLAGRVTTAFENGQLEQRVGVGIDRDAHVLLCGNPKMIEEMRLLLEQRGLKKHRRRTPGHFNFEKYW